MDTRCSIFSSIGPDVRCQCWIMGILNYTQLLKRSRILQDITTSSPWSALSCAVSIDKYWRTLPDNTLFHPYFIIPFLGDTKDQTWTSMVCSFTDSTKLSSLMRWSIWGSISVVTSPMTETCTGSYESCMVNQTCWSESLLRALWMSNCLVSIFLLSFV